MDAKHVNAERRKRKAVTLKLPAHYSAVPKKVEAAVLAPPPVLNKGIGKGNINVALTVTIKTEDENLHESTRIIQLTKGNAEDVKCTNRLDLSNQLKTFADHVMRTYNQVTPWGNDIESFPDGNPKALKMLEPAKNEVAPTVAHFDTVENGTGSKPVQLPGPNVAIPPASKLPVKPTQKTK